MARSTISINLFAKAGSRSARTSMMMRLASCHSKPAGESRPVQLPAVEVNRMVTHVRQTPPLVRIAEDGQRLTQLAQAAGEPFGKSAGGGGIVDQREHHRRPSGGGAKIMLAKVSRERRQPQTTQVMILERQFQCPPVIEEEHRGRFQGDDAQRHGLAEGPDHQSELPPRPIIRNSDFGARDRPVPP